MSGGSSQPANTSSTTKQEPWGGAIPYLLGQQGKQGLFPLAEQYFNQFNQLKPQQQGLGDYYGKVLEDRYHTLSNEGISDEFFGGEFDPRAGMTKAAQGTAAKGQSFTENLQRGMQSLGINNPQQALQGMLSGKIDNPYLAGLQKQYIDRSMQGYNDMLKQMNQQVMPNIASQAFASGGYGGSRQGIAEGLALQQASQNARDLSQSAQGYGNQLYSDAYQTAQGLKGNTANLLANLAASQEQFNAGQQQQGSQFNAGLLQQMAEANAQRQQQTGQFNAGLDMQQQAARAQNRLQGVDIWKQSQGMQDNIYNQLQSIYGMPQNQYQMALNQLAQIISPGAALGGTSSSNSQIPIYSNPWGQAIGTAGSIAGLLGSLGG